MLSWEEKQFLSGEKIVEHLVVRLLPSSLFQNVDLIRISRALAQSLPFSKVQHKIVTTDAQPSQPGQEHLMVLVTGQLIVSRASRIL